MSDIYISSDAHFAHSAIIRLCNRPFSSVSEMDEVLIDNINRVVKPNDTLYNLGDWCYWKCSNEEYYNKVKQFRSRIKCKDVRLIFGNHDKKLMKDRDAQQLFSYCTMYEMMNYKGIDFVMFHHPILDWDKMSHGSIHTFGHCHYSLKDSTKGRMIDVGVDNPLCDFTPFKIDTIIDIMKDKKIDRLHHSKQESVV